MAKKVSKRAKPKHKKKHRKKSAKKSKTQKRSKAKGKSKEQEDADWQKFLTMVEDLVEEEFSERRRIEHKKKLYESHINQVVGNKLFAQFKQAVTKNFTLDPDLMRDLYRKRVREKMKGSKDKFVEFMRGEMLLLDALRVVDHNYYGVKIVDREGKRPIYDFADYFDDDAVMDAGDLWDMYHEA